MTTDLWPIRDQWRSAVNGEASNIVWTIGRLFNENTDPQSTKKSMVSQHWLDTSLVLGHLHPSRWCIPACSYHNCFKVMALQSGSKIYAIPIHTLPARKDRYSFFVIHCCMQYKALLNGVLMRLNKLKKPQIRINFTWKGFNNGCHL